MTLSAQPSRVNSQISTPRLTPLRMIERNRNTDKDDINRLENKIKALESDIVIAKQLGEERRLDKLEMSLTNTSIPALIDNSLLDEDVNLDDMMDSPTKKQKELMNKVAELMTSGKDTKGDALHDSVLHEDELAILGDMRSGKESTQTQALVKTDAKDLIIEYDEYEK